MNLGCPETASRRAAAHFLAGIVLLALCAFGPALSRSQEASSGAGWRDVTVTQYQEHLADLDSIVAACQKQRSSAAAAQAKFPACNPAQTGPNDRVRWLTGAATDTREIRYDWLRSVLTRAAEKDEVAQKDIFGAITRTKNNPASASALLIDARHRLQEDERQAQNPPGASPDYSSERKTLSAILSQRAYRGVADESKMGKFREWIFNLLDKFFSGLVRFGSSAPWIVWVLRILLIAAIGTALAWLLLRIERRSRIRLVPDWSRRLEHPQRANGNCGSRMRRQWQRRVSGARPSTFFTGHRSPRLESRRLWPADRARTPREYLALLAGQRSAQIQPDRADAEALSARGTAAAMAQAADFNAALEHAAALGVAAE